MQERQFDPWQREAIEISDGRHLVLAPPGCGKTDILTERVVHAHENGVEYRVNFREIKNRCYGGAREPDDQHKYKMGLATQISGGRHHPKHGAHAGIQEDR